MNINDFINSIDSKIYNRIRESKSDAECRRYLKEHLQKQCDIPIVSTRTFEKEIELYVDTETDEWVLKHKGIIKKRAKSKFECLLTKQEIKKRLGV